MEQIKEELYEHQMETIVEPFLQKKRHEGQLCVNPDVELHYQWYGLDVPKGNIVMIHGYTECAEKHRETVYYFLSEGYQVFQVDLRGHGFSTREVMPEDVTHIDRMDDYVSDLHTFIEKLVKRNTKKKPLYLYAHSMGGAVGILYQITYPGTFKKLILSSPMIAPLTGQLPMWAAKIIADTVVRRGKGRLPMVGSTYYRPETFTEKGETSEARWSYYAKKKEAIRKYQNYCPTYGWISAACSVKKRILKNGNTSLVKEPVLLFQAEHDDYVDVAAQKKWIEKLKNGRIVLMPGTTHEIYMSHDHVVASYWEKILSFLEEKAGEQE